MKVKVCKSDKELLTLLNHRINTLNKKAAKTAHPESSMLKFAAIELELLRLSVPGYQGNA